MTEQERPTTELGHCLVTGGAGFLGRNLARELVRRGHPVRVLDVRPPPDAGAKPELEVVIGDIRKLEDVRSACRGIDTVFHTAAIVTLLEFASREHREEVHAVNVTGTENVVTAARDAGVARLVHTSTNNVTFDGVADGEDETSPYVAAPRDLYTKSKILAEKAALAANGDGKLLTCAIRPGGIFGPGEQRFLPRVVDQLVAGRFVVTIGDGKALSDNTYVDNLVDGQIAAARHLVPGSPVCGQAYFITDEAPINYFEFFRPLIEGLGYPFPRWKIPIAAIYPVMSVWEWLHGALGIPHPPLTRMELRKVGTTHFYRTDRARRDLGWSPRVPPGEVAERCLAYCRELLAARKG